MSSSVLLLFVLLVVVFMLAILQYKRTFGGGTTLEHQAHNGLAGLMNGLSIWARGCRDFATMRTALWRFRFGHTVALPLARSWGAIGVGNAL